MGNAALRDLAVTREHSNESFRESTVAVDAYNWLHRYLNNPYIQYMDAEDYTSRSGRELPQILALLRGLPKFLQAEMAPILVFDGAAHNLKAEEQQSREELQEELKKEAAKARSQGNIEKARRLEAQSLSIPPDAADLAMELCERFGIPTVNAPSAGEAQAAYIAAQGDAEYVLSEDYDALLFKSPSTLRRFTSASNPTEVMDFGETILETGFSHQQLVDVAILCGTDYNDGVHGVGPARASRLVDDHGDIYGALDDWGAEIEHVSEIRDIFLDPAVTDSYSVPESISIDVERGREFLEDELGLTSEPVESELSRIQDAL